nr:MAG TPA: hypothetical protein [Bacteriophage sp.]
MVSIIIRIISFYFMISFFYIKIISSLRKIIFISVYI